MELDRMLRVPPWVLRAAEKNNEAKQLSPSSRESKCFDQATLQSLGAPSGWNRQDSLKWGWQPAMENGELARTRALRDSLTLTPAELEESLGPMLWVGDRLLGQFQKQWRLATGGKHTTWKKTFILVNSYTLEVTGDQEYRQCQSTLGGSIISGTSHRNDLSIY